MTYRISAMDLSAFVGPRECSRAADLVPDKDAVVKHARIGELAFQYVAWMRGKDIVRWSQRKGSTTLWDLDRIWASSPHGAQLDSAVVLSTHRKGYSERVL